MNYTACAKTSDLPPGATMPVVAAGQKILLANVAGAFYAIQQKCPHLGADLCKGKLDGKVVTCRMHGAAFDVTTGDVVNPARILFFKAHPKGPRTYPTRVESGEILVGV